MYIFCPFHFQVSQRDVWFVRSAFAFTPPSVTAVIKVVCRARAPLRANCTALINAREVRAKKKGNDSWDSRLCKSLGNRDSVQIDRRFMMLATDDTVCNASRAARAKMSQFSDLSHYSLLT